MADNALNETFKPSGDDQKIKPAEKKFIRLEALKKRILRSFLIFWLLSTVFLFLRVILEALGSDPRSMFAAFIYLISNIFMIPFYGIFPHFMNTIQPGKNTFDAPAIIAIFCYTILILLAVAIIYILSRMKKTEEQVEQTIEKDNPINPIEIEEKIQ